MKLIVTGSIAYDYLMSFPGKFTEHLLPEHFSRVSLSFLVDSMDKRRGGCAPNIAYTLALLGERPRLMGTAGQDFRRVPPLARGGGRRHVARQRGAGQVHGVVLLQHGRSQQPDRVVLHRRHGPRGRAVVPHGGPGGPGDHLAERSRRDDPVRRRVPRARVARTSSTRASSARAWRATSSPTALHGAYMVICNDYELELIRRRPGWARPRSSAGPSSLIVTRGEQGSSVYHDGRRDRRAGRDTASDCRPDRRRRRVPRRTHEGHGARRRISRSARRLAASPRPTRSSILAARATPTPGRSSPRDTKSTSASCRSEVCQSRGQSPRRGDHPLAPAACRRYPRARPRRGARAGHRRLPRGLARVPPETGAVLPYARHDVAGVWTLRGHLPRRARGRACGVAAASSPDRFPSFFWLAHGSGPADGHHVRHRARRPRGRPDRRAVRGGPAAGRRGVLGDPASRRRFSVAHRIN